MNNETRNSSSSSPGFMRFLRQRGRFLFFLLLFVALIVYGVQSNTLPWRELQIRFTSLTQQIPPVLTTASPSIPNVSQEEVEEAVQTQRQKNNLSPLTVNQTLLRSARLVALEIEDNESLETPIDYQTMVKAVSLDPPPAKIESLTFFITADQKPEAVLSSSEAELLNQKTYTQFGVALRTAEFDDIPGTIVVILGSPDFATAQPRNQTATRETTNTPTSAPPQFTGQDLWQAVQNYRRAHELPAFEQANELCTVASIRLNELLELGKLDNHDGFDRRADEFFAKNPGWQTINENLASGYQTAVQTVEWGWDQSLGHQALIKSREYPKACTAANRGFAVLITGK